jgi:hypothetical protein
MAREMTPQERAAAIVDKVKSELTPIWLGGRQRMLLEREVAEALTATRRAALLEAAQVIPRNWLDPLLKGVRTSSCPEIEQLLQSIKAEIDRLAQEGA